LKSIFSCLETLVILIIRYQFHGLSTRYTCRIPTK
jgi:hypothetical protein